MKITEVLSRKVHTHCLDVAVRTKRITIKRKKVSLVGTSEINQQVNNNTQENTVNISLNNNNTNIVNNVNLTENTTSEPSHDSKLDLAKILASLMEDDIPPANPNTITHTDGEHSNACNTDPATGRTEGRFVSENVFNLSSRNITEAEIKVFKKGLRFVPTPEKINRWQLKNDFEKFGRNIRLRMHFPNVVTPNFFESPPFRIPSNWTPYINDVYLEMYLREIEQELMKINEYGMNYSSLNKEERDALHILSHDDSIIIKPADKGSGIVIWNRSDYVKDNSVNNRFMKT